MTSVRKGCIRCAGLEPIEFNFDAEQSRQRVLPAVKAAAKRMKTEQRAKLLTENLPDLLKVTVPSEPTGECEPLRWDEVRKMSTDRIDFGGHTKTHPILSSVAGERELLEEINGSKIRIEQELGKPVRHFAYPNGTQADVNTAAIDEVKRSGFRTAALAQGGLNFKNADPFLLRRIVVQADTPDLIFGRDATGFRR